MAVIDEDGIGWISTPNGRPLRTDSRAGRAQLLKNTKTALEEIVSNKPVVDIETARLLRRIKRINPAI